MSMCHPRSVSLTVDVPRLRRGRAGDTIRFVLWATFEFEPDAAGLAGVARQITAGVGGTDAPSAEQWVKSVRGWSGVLVNVHDFYDGVRWLQLFGEAYGDALDGTVVGQTRNSGGHLGTRQATRGPVTAVAYTTGDLTLVPRNDRDPIWFVDPDATESIVSAARDWVVTPGSRKYLTRDGGYWGLEIEGMDWKQAVVEAIDRYTNAIVICRRSKPTRMRKVELWPHGLVSYSDHDPSLSLANKIELARQPLGFAVEHIDLAFVGTENPANESWRPDPREDTWPHIREPDLRYNRPLLTSMVPDAHGIQVLTAAHLERAHDLSDWSVRHLGSDRYLVEAPDLNPWFSQPLPDPVVREKARADFGEMIMTVPLIEARSPWIDGF